MRSTTTIVLASPQPALMVGDHIRIGERRTRMQYARAWVTFLALLVWWAVWWPAREPRSPLAPRYLITAIKDSDTITIDRAAMVRAGSRAWWLR